MSKDQPSEDSLDAVMERALDGDSQAVAEFYRRFLQGQWFVPRRHQQYPLSDTPEYPSELLDLLGVRSTDRVFIPAFSSSDYVREWFGQPLECRLLQSGEELLRLVPAEWWVCVNPGRLVEKELSPWELEQLRLGSESISELVDESLGTQDGRTVAVKALAEGEFDDVRRLLKEFGIAHPEVVKIAVLVEEAQHITQAAREQKLIVSVEVDSESETNEDLRRGLIDSLNPLLIGDIGARVLVTSGDKSGLASGLLNNTDLVFEREYAPIGGLFAGIRNWFK